MPGAARVFLCGSRVHMDEAVRAPALELQEISIIFGVGSEELPVLEDVSLRVESGEFVAILGRSGCGKSTLFKILAGLVSPTGGRLLLDGRDVANARGSLAYMQQKDLLFPWRTVLGNAMLGIEMQRDAREAKALAQALLAKFGLSAFETSYPAQLSGGMRQRVALVRTVLCERPLLLLDEPFGALDALTRGDLQRWLLQAWREYRQTVLLVTHDVEEALICADRVAILSARPARVKAVIDVSLPRPRNVTDAAFVEVKGRVLDLVRDELLDVT